MTLVLALLFSLLSGVSLGMLGGGGSILTVPIPIYVRFAWFVVAMGLVMLTQQLPKVLGVQPDWSTLSRQLLPYALLLVATPVAYQMGKRRGQQGSGEGRGGGGPREHAAKRQALTAS